MTLVNFHTVREIIMCQGHWIDFVLLIPSGLMVNARVLGSLLDVLGSDWPTVNRRSLVTETLCY